MSEMTATEWVRALVKAAYPETMTSERMILASGLTKASIWTASGRLVDAGEITRIHPGLFRWKAAEEAPPIQPEQPKLEADAPRDMTVFQPFLRPVDGSDEKMGWVSSLAIADRAGKRPDHVLESMRKVRADSGLAGAPNFRDATYIDAQGKQRPMMEVSEVALPAVMAVVGGPVLMPVAIAIGEDWRRLKRMERSGGGDVNRFGDALKQMAESQERTTAMMMEGLERLTALFVRGPAQPVREGNVVPIDPQMYQGEIPGTTLRKMIGGYTSNTFLANEIASMIQAHTGPGGYTPEQQKRFINHDNIVIEWQRIIIDGQEMIVPIAAPGYEHWFGAYRTARQVVNYEVRSGAPQWQWCFTDAGANGMKARVGRVKVWFDSLKKK